MTNTPKKLNYKALCLEGGGMKGLAHVGLYRALEEMNVKITFFSGTSIGAFLALLFALGYSSKEVADEIQNKDLNDIFLDWPGGVFKNFIALFWRYGLCSGQKCRSTIRRMIERKLPLMGDLTLGQLKAQTGNSFLVAVTNNNLRRVQYFSTEITPNDRVVDVVYMSMSFPILFAPTKYIGGNYMSDGGLVDNFPIRETRKYFQSDDQVLGCKLLSEGEMVSEGSANVFQGRDDINGLFQYLVSIVTCVTQSSEDKDLTPTFWEHVVGVRVGTIGTFDLNMSANKKKEVIHQGYMDAIAQLNK